MFKKNLIATATGLTLALVVASPAMALGDFEDRFSVGGSVGTDGVGADLGWRMHQNFGVTASYNYFEFDTELEDTDVTYEGDFDLSNTMIKAEYYPFGGRFFVAAGAVDMSNGFTLMGTPTEDGTYDINGTEYDSSDFSSLNADVEINNDIAPYLGIGWKSSHKPGLSFFSDLGVFYVDPTVSLSADYDSTLVDPVTRAQLEQDIQDEEDELQDDLGKWNLYPVAQIGIQYVF